MEIKFKVSLTTNKLARDAGARGEWRGFKCRHNGGRVLVITCGDNEEADRLRGLADESHDVVWYCDLDCRRAEGNGDEGGGQ